MNHTAALLATNSELKLFTDFSNSKIKKIKACFCGFLLASNVKLLHICFCVWFRRDNFSLCRHFRLQTLYFERHQFGYFSYSTWHTLDIQSSMGSLELA